jgi:hypothetical protein
MGQGTTVLPDIGAEKMKDSFCRMNGKYIYYVFSKYICPLISGEASDLGISGQDPLRSEIRWDMRLE